MSFFKEKDKIDFVTLPTPDNTISFFQTIKVLSEQYWSITQPDRNLYGFQVQQNTIWKPGLSDAELLKFQDVVGFSFPEPLRNFYKVMNGLNKPGINIYGNDGTKFAFNEIFYSYPQDIGKVKELIEWIYNANSISENDIVSSGISRIFPVCGHRFILIDVPGNPILSMYGDDIIYWADDLSKLLANELFKNISNARDFERLKNSEYNIGFWVGEK